MSFLITHPFLHLLSFCAKFSICCPFLNFIFKTLSTTWNCVPVTNDYFQKSNRSSFRVNNLTWLVWFFFSQLQIRGCSINRYDNNQKMACLKKKKKKKTSEYRTTSFLDSYQRLIVSTTLMQRHVLTIELGIIHIQKNSCIFKVVLKYVQVIMNQ